MVAKPSAKRDLMVYGNTFIEVLPSGETVRLDPTDVVVEPDIEIAGGSAQPNDDFINIWKPYGKHRVVCGKCKFVGYKRHTKFSRACPVKKCSGLLRLKAK